MNYSAIIVLGHLMDQNGILNDESSARMDVAINAYRNKEAPLIVTCGWPYREDSDLPIANAMKAYAVLNGNIPRDDIVTEVNSRDTVGDALFTKINFVDKNNWKDFLVVTSDYHCRRTQEIFDFIYGEGYSFEVRPAKTGNLDAMKISEQESTEVFRNTFRNIPQGDTAAIFQRLSEQHPYYNGDAHPKIGLEAKIEYL